MKRIFAVIISMTLFFTLALPSFAALDPQDTSCTAGFVGGDIDGDGKVTSADAAQLMQYLTGWSIGGDASHADTLRDGVINAKDAAKLMQYLAGWNVGRLCHDDEYVTVKDSTVMEQGTARRVCRVCGDFVEEAIPYKTYSVCGTDIAEYGILYGTNGMSYDNDLDILRIINYTADNLLDCHFELAQITSKSRSKKAYEHEILIGDVSQFSRDGLPDMSDGQPRYGVTEDGTVYFNVKNAAFLGEMWLEFLRAGFGIDYKIINNKDPLLELRSANENGADVQPFERTYDPVDPAADGYRLVFEDDFDGDNVNWDVWTDRNPGDSGDGFYSAASQCSIRDGSLVIANSYRDDGPFGPGRYGAELALAEWQERGYFEARIKCSGNAGGGWSAFWFQGHAPYTPERSRGGVGDGGAEIDVLELFGKSSGLKYNIYCGGGEGSENGRYEEYLSGQYGGPVDMTLDYHTYALEWDEDFYTFYVDGIIVGRTAFADGTATGTEQLILGLELSDGCSAADESVTEEMLVDYVRIYRK